MQSRSLVRRIRITPVNPEVHGSSVEIVIIKRRVDDDVTVVVILTTSTFTKDAVDFVDRIEGMKVVLINGDHAAILEACPDEVSRSLAEDYEEWLGWVTEPIRPYLVTRPMACVYQRLQLPDDALSFNEAKDYAAQLARESEKMVWLLRRVSIRFEATGKADPPAKATPHMPCEPYVVFGGKRVQFDFTGNSI
jgi:hypothetical protein